MSAMMHRALRGSWRSSCCSLARARAAAVERILRFVSDVDGRA